MHLCGSRRWVASLAFAYLRPKEISEGDVWRGADRYAANRTVPSVQRFPRANDSTSLIVLTQPRSRRPRAFGRMRVVVRLALGMLPLASFAVSVSSLWKPSNPNRGSRQAQRNWN